MTTMRENEWPVVTVENYEETCSFLKDKLSFEVMKVEEGACALRLDQFYVTLKRAEGITPNGSKGMSDSKKEPDSPNLYVPVDNIEAYYEEVLEHKTELWFAKRMLHYDFEGFGVICNGVKLIFFKDYHGPYAPKTWYWGDMPVP